MKIFALILALLMLFGCSAEEPQNKPEEVFKKEADEVIEKTEELDKKPVPEKLNFGLEDFGATVLGQVQFLGDELIYVYAYNKDEGDDAGFLTTISKAVLPTEEVEILHEGRAFMEYSQVMRVSEVALSNDWVYTGKEIFSASFGDGEDMVYELDGEVSDQDFCFDTQKIFYITGEGKTKIAAKAVAYDQEMEIYEHKGSEHEFINGISVSPDGEYIVFMVCNYTAMSPQKLVCIDYLGNLIFEEEAAEYFNFQMRWRNCTEFVLFYYDTDSGISAAKVFGYNGEVKNEFPLEFFPQTVQNSIGKSSPYVLICETVEKAHFSYRLWVLNLESGDYEEVYTSPTNGIIRGFDLSDGGKTAVWIENDDIMKMDIR